MIGLFCFVLTVPGSPFKSKLRLEAENAVLRHQLIVLRRRLVASVSRLRDYSELHEALVKSAVEYERQELHS
jgi:hypothetical protein